MLEMLFFLAVAMHLDISNDFPHTICDSAKAVMEDLDSNTRELMLETPNEWLPLLFDESIGRYIRNIYGLWGENEILIEKCKEKIGREDPEVCSALILRKVADLIRESAPNILVKKLVQQTNNLRKTKIDSSFLNKDQSIQIVIEYLNDNLRKEGHDINIQLHPSVMNIYNDNVNLRARPDMDVDDVLGVLRRVVMELDLCMRQEPSVIKIRRGCFD